MNTKFVALLLGVLFVLSTVAVAQLPTATIVGNVTDPTNAAVVGAKVQVRDMNTNRLRTAVTGAQGEYTVSALLPGMYEVTISQTGFKQLVESNLELAADQTSRLDAKLEVGGDKVVVNVDDTVGAVNTETSSKGAVVTPVEIAEMPLNGRDFNDLAFNMPGVMPQEEGGKGTSYTTNGARSDQSNVIVEGLNNTNPRDAGAEATPPLDSLQEFKMQTSNYSAEYGRVAGGVINLVMKRGGNQLHGGVFEFLRNDLFDARSYFDSTARKSELRRNQFGATIGGPVVIPHLYNGHDHTFFFASWESFRELAGSNNIGTVPTLLERGIDPNTGNALGYYDFSQSYNAKSGKQLAPNSLIDPWCKQPQPTPCIFQNNRIPYGSINPISLALLNFYPLPTPDLTPTATGANNYRSYAVSPDQWDNFVLKIDQQISSKDEFSARALVKQDDSGDPFSGTNIGLFGATTKHKELMLGITETRIFTPTLINEFRLGLTRMKSNETAADAGTNWARLLGMCPPHATPTPCATDNPLYAQFPKISFGGKVSGYLGLGDSTTNPVRYTTNNYNLNDILTWNRGKHTVKFGADILRVQYFQATNSNFSGSVGFDSGGKKTGVGMADFYVGAVNSVSVTLGSPFNHIFNNNYAGFVQDDYKVLSSLTLNLGLRYEYEAMPYESNGQWSSYDPELHQVVTAGTPTDSQLAVIKQWDPNYIADLQNFTPASDHGLPQTLVTPNKKRFAPRVGFAWRPFDDNHTVISGGYGIFYTGSRLSALRTEMAGQYPFSLPISFDTTGLVSISDPWATTPKVNLTSQSGIDFHPKSAYLQSWNLTLQHEIGRGVTVEVGYAGSKGTHLSRLIDINQYVPGVCDPNGCRQVNPYQVPAGMEVVGLRPVDSNFGSINYFTFNSNSNYNAGILTIRKKFEHGLMFRANYTYGKSIDDASGVNYAGAGGVSGAQNSQDPSGERGRSNFDRRHMLTGNFVYKLPINKTVFLRGWQLAGSSRIYSGAPFTPQYSYSKDAGSYSRPDYTPNAPGCNGDPLNAPTTPGVKTWFNMACFTAPFVPANNPSGIGIFGNSGRNTLNGPGSFTVDLALSRTFRVTENGKLQFRWEVFNVLNHTNFKLPNVTLDSPGAGTITDASANRIMQLGMKYNF